MLALSNLRAPVDAFFDKVLVNAPDPDVRVNRLRLLNRIREATIDGRRISAKSAADMRLSALWSCAFFFPLAPAGRGLRRLASRRRG